MEGASEESTSAYSTLSPRGLQLAAVLGFSRLPEEEGGPGERYGQAGAVVGSSLLLFGGCEPGGRFLDELWLLDLAGPRPGPWRPRVALPGEAWPPARHFHAAVAHGDALYIFSGKSNGYLNDIWRYDTRLSVWHRLPPVTGPAPSRRYGHTVVEFGGDLYLFGGFDDMGLTCNDVWRYSPSLNLWTPELHLQSEAPDALHHVAATYQGSLLVWGGMDASDALYEFRFGSKSWSTVQVRTPPELRPRPKWGAQCFVWDDCFYVVGGTDALVCHRSVWQFSMLTCEWTLLGEGDGWNPRYYFTLVQHGTDIILFGGKNLSNFAFNDTHLWTFRASDNQPRSTYRQDFLQLMQSANPADEDVVTLYPAPKGAAPVYAHRAVLYSRAPALRNVSELPMNRELLEALLHYLYTSQLPATLTRAQLMELAWLADAPLQLPVLKRRLELELLAKTDRSCVVPTLRWCIESRKMPRLAAASVNLIIPAFDALRSQLRDELPDDYYAGLKELARAAKAKKT